MARTFERHLPELHEVLDAYPPLCEDFMKESRTAIQGILSGDDDRMLVIQGPCSFYPVRAGLEHARAMKDLQWEMRDALVLVERVYIQKPRTRAGWPGIQLQPDPNGPINANKGIWESRRAMHQAAKILPVADEILHTENGVYFDDLLSYGAIGARNVESMSHRWVASGLDFPVGMKNPRSGNIHSAVDAIVVAQQPNTLVMNRAQYVTSGNPFAHLVLRGGQGHPNYDCVSVEEASRLLRHANVRNPAIVIDASHENSVDPVSKKKTPERQIKVLRQIVKNRYFNPEVFGDVRGVMFESFIQPGNQPVGPAMRMDGLSITDPCVGLNESIAVLQEIAEEVRRHRKIHE